MCDRCVPAVRRLQSAPAWLGILCLHLPRPQSHLLHRHRRRVNSSFIVFTTTRLLGPKVSARPLSVRGYFGMVKECQSVRHPEIFALTLGR